MKPDAPKTKKGPISSLEVFETPKHLDTPEISLEPPAGQALDPNGSEDKLRDKTHCLSTISQPTI
jgi:hypothetical protein